MTDAIQLVGLTKVYGSVRALDAITLNVDRGEILGYMGANGAGKTTTIKLLTGLLRPTSGDARIAGYSIVTEPLRVKARIGYVPESGAIYEKLTPREFLASVGELHGMDEARIEQRIRELMAYFSLQNRMNDRMDTFSKGMKQKVCFSAALLHDPEALFLDEPLNGMDVETVLLIKDLIKRLASDGKTIFYTSHLVDVVEKICTRIAVLDRGRLVKTGTIDELLDATSTRSLESALMRLWGRDSPERPA
jgi:ABC-2 type transport system ATP-binding protein